MRIRIDRKLPQLCTSILEVSGYVTGKKIPQQVQFKKKKILFQCCLDSQNLLCSETLIWCIFTIFFKYPILTLEEAMNLL